MFAIQAEAHVDMFSDKSHSSVKATLQQSKLTIFIHLLVITSYTRIIFIK